MLTGLRTRVILDGSDARQCVLLANKVGMGLSFGVQYANRVDSADPKVRQFHGRIVLPGNRGFDLFGQPKILAEECFTPDVVRGLSWCWMLHHPRKSLTSNDLADHCMQNFLGLMGRAVRGDLPEWEYN